MKLSDDWQLQAATGDNSAPLVLSSLQAWDASTDDKLRYFSGTLRYSREFSVSPQALRAYRKAAYSWDSHDVTALLDLSSSD